MTASTAAAASRALVSPLLPDEFGETVARHEGGRPSYYVALPLETPSGFTNYDATEMKVTTEWKRLLGEVFRIQGFTEIDPPPVEYAQNLQLSGGLDKQIFGVSRLQDGSLTKLALPFDRTVPMAIFLARNSLNMTFPYARYDIGWSWRGEHAKLGRYRAFIQADIDLIAPQLSALTDAQCIVTMIQGLQKLGVPNCQVFLNHVEIAKSFLTNEGIEPEKFNDALRVIDKLKADNEREVIGELVEKIAGMTPEKAKALLDKMSYRGSLAEFKFSEAPTAQGAEGLTHLQEIERLSIKMGIDPGVLQFAPNLTRGLNYYTGVLFETFMPGKEHYGSIASGGRYDNLVGEFNKKVKLQGVGGSIGMTRLFDVMKAEKLVDLSKQTGAQMFVGYRTPAEFDTAIQVATRLRSIGVYTEMNMGISKVKKQLDFVDSKGIPYAILVMNPDEIVLKRTYIKKGSEEQTEQVTFKTIEAMALYVKELKEREGLDPKTRSSAPAAAEAAAASS